MVVTWNALCQLAELTIQTGLLVCAIISIYMNHKKK